MTERFCRVCKGWHNPQAWPHNCMPERVLTASDLPAPMLINDSMEPVQSQLDGRMYDSKAALRATYRPSGNSEGKSYVEVGNDSSLSNPKRKEVTIDRQAVKASIGKAFSQAGLGA